MILKKDQLPTKLQNILGNQNIEFAFLNDKQFRSWLKLDVIIKYFFLTIFPLAVFGFMILFLYLSSNLDPSFFDELKKPFDFGSWKFLFGLFLFFSLPTFFLFKICFNLFDYFSDVYVVGLKDKLILFKINKLLRFSKSKSVLYELITDIILNKDEYNCLKIEIKNFQDYFIRNFENGFYKRKKEIVSFKKRNLISILLLHKSIPTEESVVRYRLIYKLYAYMKKNDYQIPFFNNFTRDNILYLNTSNFFAHEKINNKVKEFVGLENMIFEKAGLDSEEIKFLKQHVFIRK